MADLPKDDECNNDNSHNASEDMLPDCYRLFIMEVLGESHD
jgi:hypothetical protein